MTKISKEKIDNTRILTAEKVNEITEKENMGLPLHRDEKLWFKNITGVRKAGLSYAMSNDEVDEYAKCKLSIHYFAEKYAKIKLEDGTIDNMKLRDYQSEIIDLYTKNRYSILMASRQTGKCNSFSTNVLVLDEKSNKKFKVPFFELYYSVIRLKRKLIFLEKTKLFLYRLYMKF